MAQSISLAFRPGFSLPRLSRWLVRVCWRMGLLVVAAVLMFPELVLAQAPQIHSLYVPKTWKVGAPPLPLRVQIDANRTTSPSVRINWQLDNKPPQTETFARSTLVGSYEPNLVGLSGSLHLTEAGLHHLRVWFSDPSNQTTLGDTLTVPILALEHDFERRVLIEEFTGTWCGWCPAGIELVEQLVETHPGRIVPVMVHNNDPMAFEEGDILTNLANVSGFPAAQIDRTTFPGIVVAPALNRSLWAAATEAQLRAASRATLEAQVSYNDTTRQITVDLSTTFLTDFEGTPRFGVHLLEDSMAYSGAGWDQANFLNTFPESKWFGRGNPIRDFVHRHVLRAIPGGVRGINGVIPVQVTAGQRFSHRLTFPRPRGSQLRHLTVVAYIYNESGSNKLKEIFQTVEVPVVPRSSVSRSPYRDLVFDTRLAPNPAAHGHTELHFRLASAQPARYTLFDALGRELQQADLGFLKAGHHCLPLELHGLAPGLYSVALTAGSHTQVERLVVR